MGKSNKNVFKTLFSTVKSLNKEKNEHSDRVQNPRKVHKGRCLWSLGKSSSRSRDPMDMEEIKYVQIEKEEGEKQDQAQGKGSEQALETVEVEQEGEVVQKVEVEEPEEKVVQKVRVEEQQEKLVPKVEVEVEVDDEKEVIEKEPEEQKELENEGLGEYEVLEKEDVEEHKGFGREELEGKGFIREEIEWQTESLLLVDEAASRIQAAFRCYMARRRYFQSSKALVRVQALVRGRNVRRAMVKLRCIHALVKVQSLVRGHLVRKSELGLSVQRHLKQSKLLRIEQEQGHSHNTITIGEVEVQNDLVRYSIPKGARVCGETFLHDPCEASESSKQDEKLSEAHPYTEGGVLGSKTTGNTCQIPCESTIALKQHDNLRDVDIDNKNDNVQGNVNKDLVEDPRLSGSDMSFSIKDEDECSEHSSLTKEQDECWELCSQTKGQEECPELPLSVNEQEEVGIVSAFSSSLGSIVMHSSSPSLTSSSTTDTTLEDISIGGTYLTTPSKQENNPGTNEDTTQALSNDPVTIMSDQPRGFVFHNDEHIEEKSLCASASNVSFLDMVGPMLVEQMDTLMTSKKEQGEFVETNLKLIGEATNEPLGRVTGSKQELESPSPSLVIPNYMSTTKSSNAKKVIGSPKMRKSDVQSHWQANNKQDSPKLRRDYPQQRLDSPKTKVDSLKMKTDSPKQTPDSPKLRLDSPKPRVDSPKVRLGSLKPKQEDLSKHERDPLKMRQDSLNLVKVDSYSVKRRHSLSGLEANNCNARGS